MISQRPVSPLRRTTPAAIDQGKAAVLERALAWLLAGYLLVQFIGLPVLALGPSWALWPTLPDLFFWAALACAALYQRRLPAVHLPVWRGLLLLGALSVLSFGLLWVMRDGHMSTAVPFGLFQLFKLFQTVATFWMVARLRPDAATLRLWEKAIAVSFTLMVVTVVWTFLSPTLPTWLGTFMPRGAGVSGPWEAVYRHTQAGLGLIGYNHAHVSAIVMLQGGLLILLRRGRSSSLILIAMLVACFLSGARAGLAGCLLFIALQGRSMPLRLTLGLLLAGALAFLAMPELLQRLSDLIERQATILDPADASNLAGRTDIWRTYLDGLVRDPLRLLIGSGFGSGTGNFGSNAHMLPLQVIYETGLAGFLVFAAFFVQLHGQLFRQGGWSSRVLLHLLAGFWLSSATTETFYPNSAFGSFLPLLALTVALALGRPGLSSTPTRP